MENIKKMSFNLSILNRKNIEENIDVFLNHFYKSEFISSEDKRSKYFFALNELQKNSIPISKDSIFIKENPNNDIFKFLLINEQFSENNNKTHLYYKSNKEIKESILKALSLIESLNPSLYILINKLVGTIIFSRNGDFSSATAQTHLGIIFLNPTDSWSIDDYAEAIYHEFIHLSIFLEDMIHSLFIRNDQIDEPLVKSVLRGVNRPLDRSFHAAIVSIGIMHLHYMLGNSKNSVMYMSELSEVIEELSQMENFLDTKGKELLHNMKLFLSSQDFESINSSIGYSYNYCEKRDDEARTKNLPQN